MCPFFWGKISSSFYPLCIIGPNGSGKSQFLQVIAEIFQSVFHKLVPEEERLESNADLQFEIEYLICPSTEQEPVHVSISRLADGKRRSTLKVQKKVRDKWMECDLSSPATRELLPKKIVGYTSGDNETLSLPFLITRSGYAEEVSEQALDMGTKNRLVPDTRLMMIDYGTHLEVLVANLLLSTDAQRKALLQEANLRDIHSFRCIIQLAHTAAPKAPAKIITRAKRKGIQLTDELEQYIENLKRCATCYHYDEKTETYIFDYWINDDTKKAFRYFWESTLGLYSSFHKLAMLNDLVISKTTRDRFKKDTKTRRFATRLPEPQDEEKVFRFERVSFTAHSNGEVVDYVSLSDGEHQLAQILGMFCMIAFPGVLFLLDEPESHFNPQWRIKIISRVLDLSTNNGVRRENSGAAKQDCLLSTHAPFVPSDMPRNKVFIFCKEAGKISYRHPDIETFGTTFDNILEECFDVRPPISEVSRNEIEDLRKSKSRKKIEDGLNRLGYSVEKAFLADRLRQLNLKGKG